MYSVQSLLWCIDDWQCVLRTHQLYWNRAGRSILGIDTPFWFALYLIFVLIKKKHFHTFPSRRSGKIQKRRKNRNIYRSLLNEKMLWLTVKHYKWSLYFYHHQFSNFSHPEKFSQIFQKCMLDVSPTKCIHILFPIKKKIETWLT